MVRLGALSGRGEVLIGGIPHGQVHYAIEECHQGGLGGRRGQITGDDQLLRAIWDQAFEVQLASAAGPIAAAIASRTTGSRLIRETEGLVAHQLLNDRRTAPRSAPRRRTMLETIAVILIILWLLGMVSGYTLGNFIYVLLVIAIVLFLVRLISGRRV